MAPAHKDDTLNQREATNFFHCGLSYDGREEEDDMEKRWWCQGPFLYGET